jgi:hypothetical protein
MHNYIIFLKINSFQKIFEFFSWITFQWPLVERINPNTWFVNGKIFFTNVKNNKNNFHILNFILI